MEEPWIGTSVNTLILQHETYFAPELFIFCEYRYNRNYSRNLLMLCPRFKKLDLGVPLMFLSGQILSKYAKSSDGRTLSNGTQNLKSKPL